MYKLFANQTCPYVQRVLIGKNIREISDATLPIQWIEFSNPPEELIAINPDWTVPTLSYAPYRGFDDSVQILEFLDTLEGYGPKLFGNNSIEIAASRFLIRQLQIQIIQPIKECLLRSHNPAKLTAPAEKLQRGFEFLSKNLPEVGFFMGDIPKAPDIILAPFFNQLKAARALNSKLPIPSPLAKTGIYFKALLENKYITKICPNQEDISKQIQQFYALPPQLLQIQQASTQILTDEEIKHAVITKLKNSPWQVIKDKAATYLEANIAFTNPTETIRTITALHAMEETVRHHAKITLSGYSCLDISLCTHKPTSGITAKDIAFAEAFVEMILSEHKYGEEESSLFN